MSELILDIVNFLCYSNYQFVVPLYKITLLKGPSGVGKTTIFNAISWVLFNKPKQAAQTKKTIVTLTLPYLTVQRSTKPEELLVVYNNITYNNEAAQQIIVTLYGKYDFWLSTSYVQQECLNNFLSARQEDKLEILNNLAYHQDDPNYYINTINGHVNQQYQQYQQYQQNYHLQQQQLALMPTVNSKVLPVEKVTELEQKLSQLNIIIEEEQQKQEQYKVNCRMVTYLQEELRKITTKIITAPVTVQNNSPYTIEQLQQLSTIKILPMLAPVTDNYTMNDYNEAVIKENQQVQYKTVIKQLAGYTISDFLTLQNIIQEYQKLYAIPTPLPLLPVNNYVAGAEPIFNYVAKYHYDTTITEETIQHKIKEIKQWLQDHSDACRNQIVATNEWQLLQNKQSCPFCTKPLLLSNGTLQGISDERLQQVNDNYTLCCTIKNQHNVYEQELNYYNSQLNLRELSKLHEQQYKATFDNQLNQWKYNEQEKKKQYESIIATNKERTALLAAYEIYSTRMRAILAEHPMLPTIIPTYDKLVGAINSLTIQDDTSQFISSASIQQSIAKQIEYATYIKQVELLKNILQYYNHTDLTKWQQLYTNIITYQKLYNTYLVEKEKQDLNIANIQKQLDQLLILQDNSEYITQIIAIVQQIQQVLSDNKQCIEIEKQQNKIQEIYSHSNKQYEIVSSLQQFGQEAKLAEYDVLQEKVTNLNNTMEELNNLMFNYKISTELKLFHTNKQKVEKPKVNLTITCGPLIFDTHNALSVGEKYRVSLALTLAINCCTGSNLLLLDECLSSVDEINQALAIQALKQRNNCTIIIIMHNGSNVDFDNIITLK